MQAEHVRRRGAANRLIGERFGARVAVTTGKHLRERGAPEHLRADVVLGCRLLARPRECLRLVVAILLVEHVGERRRDREPPLVLAARLEPVVTGAELLLGCVQIAGHPLDSAGITARAASLNVIPCSS